MKYLLLFTLILLLILCYNKKEYLTNMKNGIIEEIKTNEEGEDNNEKSEIDQLREKCKWSCGRNIFINTGKPECYPDINGKYETYEECINTGCEMNINSCVLNNSTKYVNSCKDISNEENCNNSYYYENKMNINNININPQRCQWINNGEESYCRNSENGIELLYNKCDIPTCKKYYKPIDNDDRNKMTETSCNNENNMCGEILDDNGEIIEYSGINSSNYLVNCIKDNREYLNSELSEKEQLYKSLNKGDNLCNNSNISDIEEQLCEPEICPLGLKIVEKCENVLANECEEYGEKFSIGSSQITAYGKNRINIDNIEGRNTEWNTLENNYVIPCRLSSENDSINQCIGKTPDKNGLIQICKTRNKCFNKDCGQYGIGYNNKSGINRGYCDNNTGECVCNTEEGFSGENCELRLGKPTSQCAQEGEVCAVYDNNGNRNGRWWDATNGWGCCKTGDIGKLNDDLIPVYGKNVTYSYEAYELGLKWTSYNTINYIDDDDMIIKRPSKNYSNKNMFVDPVDIDLSKTPIISIPNSTFDGLSKNTEIDYCDNNICDEYKKYVEGDESDYTFVGWGDSNGLDVKSGEFNLDPKEALFCEHASGPNIQVRRCKKCSDMKVNDTAWASTASVNSQQSMLNWAIDQCSMDNPRSIKSDFTDPGLGRSTYESYHLCVKNGDSVSTCKVSPGGNGRNLGDIPVGVCQAARGNNSVRGNNIEEQGAIKKSSLGCPSR